MMNLTYIVAVALLFLNSTAFAKKPVEPCKIKSRQMTLVKNCYTGEMSKNLDGGGQFIASLAAKGSELNYCYNSFVTLEQKAGDALVHVRVLRDGKDGTIQAYHYSMTRDEVKKSKANVPMFSLQGLKGECYSTNPDACGAGILKTIGWTDTDIPMVVAIGKASNGQLTVSHFLQSREEVERAHPRELTAKVEIDNGRLTAQILQEIRHKIVGVARQKTAAMRSGLTAKNLADQSEQFRYCSMALEGFLKDKKLTDPFNSEEKLTLSSLTNFMNGDAAVPQTAAPRRLPASPAPGRVKVPAKAKASGRH